MKNNTSKTKKKKIFLISILCFLVVAIISSICVIALNDNKSNKEFNFETTNLKSIEKNAEDVEEIEEEDGSITKVYSVEGKFEDFTGEYLYYVNNDKIKISEFKTFAMELVPPRDENNEIITTEFKQEDIDAAYKEYDDKLKDFLKKGYKVNAIFRIKSDGTFEQLESLPTGKEAVESFDNGTNYYTVNLTTPNGENMSFGIIQAPYYSAVFSFNKSNTN